VAYYNFKNNLTGEESTIEMPISEREEFLEKNPHMEQMVSTGIRISYSGYGVQVDGGFRDVLKKIKKDYPRSTINIPSVKGHGKVKK
jgi:hypothetical protein